MAKLFKVTYRLNSDKILRKMEAFTKKRLLRAGQAVEREAKILLGKGGGRGSPPQERGVSYFYGEPKNKWVRASPEGQPPYTQTGDLKNSISTELAGPYTVIVGPSVFYGKYLEFGTRNMAARPFMRPALSSVRRKIPEFFEGLI